MVRILIEWRQRDGDGDLVLVEDEVAPVMAKLQAGGIDISALHNHVLHESPRVMYMHIAGHGNAVKLAQAIHDALTETGTPAETPVTSTSQKIDLDTDKIDQALGRKGKDNGGIYQFAVPRAETIRDHGMETPASMGTSTAINFQPTGDGKAAITGDFVLLGTEVNPVISALRENGIQVTALHSHMLSEEPRLFFMHFWANDDAVKLAQGLEAALDKTNSKK
jgi:biotin operon repressor